MVMDDPPRSTKAVVMFAMAQGTTDFDGLVRTCGIPPKQLMAALSALRREGLVAFHDAINTSGITGLKLSAHGERTMKKVNGVLDADIMAKDILAGGPPHMQQTLSPVAPRPTLETAVVKVRTGRAKSNPRPPSVAEGGPVTVTHEEATPVVTTPEPAAPEQAAAPLDGYPLLAELMEREKRRMLAKEASEALERAGLSDLALEALTAIPDDTPLEVEIIRYLKERT